MTAPEAHGFSWRNRRVFAQRQGWPAGAVEACEAIEQAYPTWRPTWSPASIIRGFERPAGYLATRQGGTRRDEPPAFGVTPQELVADIEAHSSACVVCGELQEYPQGSKAPWHRAAQGPAFSPCRGWERPTVAIRSLCPACGTEIDVRAGSEVPPHQVDGEWCRARCSQRTV